jgi:hypothetical protein
MAAEFLFQYNHRVQLRIMASKRLKSRSLSAKADSPYFVTHDFSRREEPLTPACHKE